MTDENFDVLFDDEDAGGESYTGGEGDASATGVRSIQDFQELVVYHTTILTSAKNTVRVRVESALWLGESGEIDAIRPLIMVYKRDKKNPKVQKAAKYALGMFKSLEAAIQREPNETIEDALERPENAHIMETLHDIALFDRRGSRKGGGGLLRWMIILVVTFIALMVAYLMLPESALTQAFTPPTPTNTPTIDPNAPTPTLTFTPSLTPEDTLTPTPTPGIPPEESRRIQSDLLTLVGLASTSRGFLDSLTSGWTSIAQSPDSVTINRICANQTPNIPANYVLPDGYAALNPTLGQATDYINSGLSLSRNGWAYFTESCSSGGMNTERIQTGLATVRTAQDSFDAADRLLSNR